MVGGSISPNDGHIDMEEVMGWLLTQTPMLTFNCNGSSNSTMTLYIPT